MARRKKSLCFVAIVFELKDPYYLRFEANLQKKILLLQNCAVKLRIYPLMQDVIGILVKQIEEALDE